MGISGKAGSRPAAGCRGCSSATIRLYEGIVCTVSNISGVGAGIYLDSAEQLPIEFYVRIDGEDSDRCCAVMKRSKRFVSVVFI